MVDRSTTDVLALTARIVSAHVAHNRLGADTLPALIQSVYQSLATATVEDAKPEPLVPAVPWKKSVFPDFLICLEDGQRLKMLKRHLKVSYNLSPREYREKWGLPSDYPMVSPNYASHRAALAKKIGLGVRPVDAAPEVTVIPEVTIIPARRARGSKG